MKMPKGLNEPLKKVPQKWRFSVWYIFLAFFLIWFWQSMFAELTVRQIPYSEFKDRLAAGEVKECTVDKDEIRGLITPKTDQKEKPGDQTEPKPKAEEFAFRTVRIEDPNLVDALQAAKIAFSGVLPSPLSNLFWVWLLPIGVMVILWMGLSRVMGRAGAQAMSFGKSRAKIVAEKSTGVTFNDVAGCEEAKVELKEVVDFLMDPDRFSALGAKIPKGVLLVGLPGTGKTLMARAVAGEAEVPFFSLSGSDFVEMFVGVGAARVRDLFMQAKERAPCIVFIDEMDAIGRQRGVHIGSANDEREQTLNQLLVEMDGFEANTGVIILAATNRPEILDRALLRPGRFDRQVVIDAPDLEGREAILKIHSRDKKLDPSVDLHSVARATPGFCGADLANAMNEAALLAVRRNQSAIAQQDVEEAVEKVVAGPERRSRRLNDEEKRRVALHEVGHALVATFSKHGDPVHKISIVPRGRAALGYTIQLPVEEQFLQTQAELKDRIKGLLGGRAAEEIMLGDISTGAQNDLERATALARQMVCLYGMSDRIGLVQCAQRTGPRFNSEGDQGGLQRDCSEETARDIDHEVKRLLNEAYEESKALLSDHRRELEALSAELLLRETLDREAISRIVDGS